MTELAELQQRVKSVGARFRGTDEEDRKRNERWSSLLSLVEEGFARSQHEIKRLNEELARSTEEKEQVQVHGLGLTVWRDGPGPDRPFKKSTTEPK